MQDLFNHHSKTFIRMSLRTDRQYTGAPCDGRGEKIGDCGDRIGFFITLDQDRIASIAYRLQGCIHTNACANALIELVQGKQTDEAWAIDPDTVAAFLQTLPADHHHCAELAVGALYLALADTRRSRPAVQRIYGSHPEKR